MVADGVAHLSALARCRDGHILLEDAGGIVHRPALQTGEWKDCGVSRFNVAAVFAAHGALIAYHVGPGAAEACRTHRLMCIYHDMMLCSLDYGIVIVVDEGLAVVVFTVWDDIAYVSALDGVVAVFVHEIVGFFHVALIVHSGGRTLMVHHKADSLGMCIGIQCGKIKVGIRCHKVKNIVLLVTEPVFPALVPSFDKKCVEAVFCGKVDIAAYVLIVCTMLAVRFDSPVIGYAELDGRNVPGIAPLGFSGNHLPPHTHVLDRMNP